MSRTANGRENAALSRRAPGSAVAVSIVTAADLTEWHTGLPIGIVVIAAALAIVIDLIVVAIHGNETRSKRAFLLLAMIFQQYQAPLPEDGAPTRPNP
jgi:hypothetical protein